MFTFPFLLIFVIGIISILGWWSLIVEPKRNIIKNYHSINLPSKKNRKDFKEFHLEMGTEIHPFNEKTKVSEIQAPKEIIKAEFEEDLTIAQHLQKIEIIENEIIMGLFNELQNQITEIIRNK